MATSSKAPTDAFNNEVNRFFANAQGSSLHSSRPWEANWLCRGEAITLVDASGENTEASLTESGKENVRLGQTEAAANAHLTDTFKRLDSTMLAKRLGSVYGIAASMFYDYEVLTATRNLEDKRSLDPNLHALPSRSTFTAAESLTAATQAGNTPKRQH